MAISTPVAPIYDESYDVSGDLSSYVNRVVKMSAGNQVTVCGANEAGIGVLVNYSDTTATGRAAEVRHLGVANVVANGQAANIAAGDPLECIADGKVVKSTTDKHYVIGMALSAATADGVVIPVLLTGLRTLSV